MADNEINIKISTKTDTAPLEELSDMLEDIQDNADINVEVSDGSIDDATDKTEELHEELDEIDGTTATVDADATSVEEATDKATELSDKMDELDGQTATLNVDASSIDEAKSSLDETASSMDSLATAAAGIGATAGIEQMVTTADNINTSWNRLELTFANTGVNMDTLRSKTSALSDATGRSGGIIRDYFNQMGIAGITNADLISESFEGLAGKAYQTGNSIESMESRMQMMVMTGNASGRMLKQLGLDANDLSQAMGVSADQVNEAFKNMTPEERLQAISKAMGDGREANDMYKNSYEGLKTKAETAMAGLMGAVGQAILPVIVPVLQAATSAIQWLTEGFKALPGPVQAIIGGIAGAVAIFTAFAGIIGIAGQVIGGLQSGIAIIKGLSTVSSVLGTVRSTLTTINSALAASEWAALGPILLIVAAVLAVIAVLGYLYFNNEQVRETIDNLGQTLMSVAGIIVDTLVAAFEEFISILELVGQVIMDSIVNSVLMVYDTLVGFWTYIVTLGQQLFALALQVGQQIIQAVVLFLTWWITLPVQIATVLTNIITRVISFASNFVSKFVSAGTQAVSRFISYISQIPGKLASELSNALNKVNEWAATLPAKFWEAGVNAVKRFLDALGIHSPGTMQRMLVWEVSEMGERIPEEAKGVISSVGRMGSDIVDAFGNPVLETSFANNQLMGSDGSTPGGYIPGGDTVINVYGDVDSDKRVQEIVDAVRRELSWNNTTAGRSV